MGLENNTREIEVQNQELQKTNKEQTEQAHKELGKALDDLDTLDNDAELNETDSIEDTKAQDDISSHLDSNSIIEDEPSEPLENVKNHIYNKVENNGFSINDVNQAVDAKEAYEAEIRDMSQDEYHDQKELDQRVEENDSEPNMTEPSVSGNDLHQGDVSNKETDNRSRLNEPEQNAVDMERSTEEILGNDEIDDSLSDVSTVDESNVQEVKLSEPPDNVQESYRKYESDAENPEGYHDIGEFSNELNGIYSVGSMSNQEKVDAAKECVDKLNHSDLSSEEKKQSVDAPSDARTLKNPENSDWTERTDDNPWPPLNIDFPDKMGLDYDKDISPIGREEENTQLPDTGFRYDGEGGRYSGLSETQMDDIINIAKGSRPNPSTYLSQDYIDVHLAQFDNGASIIMTKEQYINYVKGSANIGILSDSTQFVMPKNYCDEIAIKANGDISVYETSLGFDIGHFDDGGGLVRIDVNSVEGLNLRMPSGNEAGANNHWIPGGKTDGGVPEAVTDLIPNNPSNVTITELK